MKRSWEESNSAYKRQVKKFVNAQVFDLNGKAVRPAVYRFFWREVVVERFPPCSPPERGAVLAAGGPMERDEALAVIGQIARLDDE